MRYFSFLIRQIRLLQKIHSKKGFLKTIHQLVHYILYDLVGTGVRLLWYRIKYPSSFADPYKIIYVNSNKIKYAVRPQLSQEYSNYGYYILGGSWDKPKEEGDKRGVVNFNSYVFYQSMRQYFCRGVPWEKTTFFKNALQEPEKYRGESPEEVKRKISEIEELFGNIKKNGYKEQRKLQERGELKQNPIIPEHNEIKLNIGRSGQLLFEDGRHRISIVKILELERIPVRIVARHEIWQEKRRAIARCKSYKEASKKFDEKVLQHPDIQDVRPDLK